MAKAKTKKSSIEKVFPGLGRRKPKKDERDQKFLIKSILPSRKAVSITSKYHYANGWWGNQGSLPHCVGFSLVHLLEDGPITQGGTAPIVDPSGLYAMAQKVDEWPGENYDGTSVRAGVKVLQTMGFIGEYRWAWDLQTMINAVLTEGPVAVGTNWYNDMFYPDAKGIIKVGGGIAGGHAWVVNGVDTKAKLFRLKNSWGREWANNGMARISFADMEKLIAEDGEICLIRELKKSL